ncbi:unnamed protein product [Mycena citricolor]|uniref:Uncharacterized protein n=1 Tax=Mycena citricolor TaxID=2018698 RepID=A0AAD2K137_9AGAR|nr:unnamed protein product [Mycena citricolor]
MIILNVAHISAVTTHVLQNTTKDKMTIKVVREALLSYYAQNHGNKNQVTKFNTKRKRDDPSFSNQQQGSGSAPDKGDKADGKKKNRRGKRSGKNQDKGKGKADQGHVHGVSKIAGAITIGLITSLTPSHPAPTISHVTHISRDGPKIRAAQEKSPVNNNGIIDTEFQKPTRKVFELAKKMDVTVTAERFRTLDKIVNEKGMLHEDAIMRSPSLVASGSNQTLDDGPPTKRSRIKEIPDVEMATGQQNDLDLLFGDSEFAQAEPVNWDEVVDFNTLLEEMDAPSAERQSA